MKKKKLTIDEIEALQAKHGVGNVEILPDGEVRVSVQPAVNQNSSLLVHLREAQKTIDDFAKESLQDREKIRNAELREQNLRREIDMWANYAFKHHGNDAGLYNGLKDLARLEEKTDAKKS